jgi:hypothetical protein
MVALRLSSWHVHRRGVFPQKVVVVEVSLIEEIILLVCLNHR